MNYVAIATGMVFLWALLLLSVAGCQKAAEANMHVRHSKGKDASGEEIESTTTYSIHKNVINIESMRIETADAAGMVDRGFEVQLTVYDDDGEEVQSMFLVFNGYLKVAESGEGYIVLGPVPGHNIKLLSSSPVEWRNLSFNVLAEPARAAHPDEMPWQQE